MITNFNLLEDTRLVIYKKVQKKAVIDFVG